MIGAGINEKLVLSNTTKINDKGNLELIFKREALTGDEMWAALEAGQDVSADTGKITIWALNLKTFQGDVKTAGQLMKELQGIESQFKQILGVYITSDKIEKYLGGTSMFAGTVITKENFGKELVKEETLKSVQEVLNKNFLRACEKNPIFDNEQTFRTKFIRQSKEKHFPKLPMFGAFIESSVISSDKTGLKWTKYEEENKLNKPDIIVQDAVPAEEAPAAKSLFKGMEENTDTVIE